ncbi:hypothetical protein QJS04_geneDACA006306 [Acorus gramineus]|uniref:Uncharacterized protein n=1 Tax=Acorus gramineus TaxID=55184 RepID=A0AAV9AZ78_ACOGR|nr:hypothetical protein QJS04_geneDACA006306 [Acorus gramineus]
MLTRSSRRSEMDGAMLIMPNELFDVIPKLRGLEIRDTNFRLSSSQTVSNSVSLTVNM